MQLNATAFELCQNVIANARVLRVSSRTNELGATLIDCGSENRGGLQMGKLLAEICMAGLGSVSFTNSNPELWSGPAVCVTTDHPLAACMASQYAGWKIEGEKFFAMGSGPMRAAAGKEALFETIGQTERAEHAVGVLESRKLPPNAVCQQIAAACELPPSALTLLVAPTASLAGGVQIVARSVETAMHKLHELGFDLNNVISGYGTAPLPPVAKDDLAAIGRTNDAILYGSEVLLFVNADDDQIATLGPKIPSSASRDYGQPFAEIFAHYNFNFYDIDPHLFSPAVVSISNLASGRMFRFGHTLPRVIHRSFMP